MRVLSFDTSSSELHLTLLDGRKPVLERLIAPSSTERQEVASLIIPQIDRAFGEVGWKRSDLELVAVGTGPGSFTGIRVAVITARSICQIFKIPLVGISLLESCYVALDIAEPAGIVLGSTSSQFFYGAFERREQNPAAQLIEPGAGKDEHVVAALSTVQNWYGDSRAAESFDSRQVLPLPKLKNVATLQAQLAFDRLSLNGFSAETFAWQNVLPLYLRSPSVTVKKNHAAPHPANES